MENLLTQSTFHFKIILIIIILFNFVQCGPGSIYYRKPAKLVYYKKFHPVVIYSKKGDFFYPGKGFKPTTVVTTIYHSHPSRLEYLLNHEKQHATRLQAAWIPLLGRPQHLDGDSGYSYNDFGSIIGSRLNEPVFTYYPRSHPNAHTNSDIKPVEEHIEGDLKYDFRTKTHSYD